METGQMEGHGRSVCFSTKDNAKTLKSFQQKLPCLDFNFYMIILTVVWIKYCQVPRELES